MSGIGRDGDKCASGYSHTIGKCERAQRNTPHGHWKDRTRISTFRTWNVEAILRTGAYTTKPLGLSEETVYLVHLIYSSFRPTFFCNHRVDLFAEGFNIFRILKKTVQYLRERLLACSD